RGASTAHDIGFRFGPPPPGGKPARSASLAYPAASFHFTWSAAKHRWLVSMDGTPAKTTDGGRLSPATVVIQYTTVRASRFPEYSTPPPYAKSTGSGTALVPARWQGLDRPLVPAQRRWRHHVHHHIRAADDLRPRAGLDRARPPVTPPKVRGFCRSRLDPAKGPVNRFSDGEIGWQLYQEVRVWLELSRPVAQLPSSGGRPAQGCSPAGGLVPSASRPLLRC